jgi:hypothetical protein
MSTHWHNNKNNYNRRSINSWFNLQPSCSTTGRVKELDDRDAPIFLHPPPLHQPSWDATIMDNKEDEDAEEAVDHLFSRGAIHPPRCLSLQVEIHLLLPTHLVAGDILRLLLHTQPVAGDILCPCTRRI